jgi:tryptophan-rich sensory protein
MAGLAVGWRLENDSALDDSTRAQPGLTGLFFGAQLPAWALLEIVLLLAAAIWTTLAFRRHDRRAMALFIPYVVWIGFAAVLNGAIVMMN